MNRRNIFGFAHLCSSIWKSYNFDHLPDLMNELLFDKQNTTSLREEAEHTSKSHNSEFYNGNIRGGGIVKKCAVGEYPKSWIGMDQAA